MGQRGMGWPEATLFVVLLALVALLFYAPALNNQAASMSDGLGFGLVVGFLLGAIWSVMVYRDLRQAHAEVHDWLTQLATVKSQAAELRADRDRERDRADAAERELRTVRIRVSAGGQGTTAPDSGQSANA